MNNEIEVKRVSVHGWTGPTKFHFQIVDVWPGAVGYGTYVFVKDQ